MPRPLRRAVVLALALLAFRAMRLRADDGYDLWLRYPRVDDAGLLAEYRGALARLVVQGDTPTLRVAREELVTGLTGLLGVAPVAAATVVDGTLLVGTPRSSRAIAALPLAAELRGLGPEGFIVRAISTSRRQEIRHLLRHAYFLINCLVIA